jgi:hypothetical protein
MQTVMCVLYTPILMFLLNTASLYNTGISSTTYHYFKTEHGIPLAQYVLEVEILCLQA